MTDRLEYLRQFGIVRIVDLGEVDAGIFRERFEFADGRRIYVDADLSGVAWQEDGRGVLLRHQQSDAVLSKALGMEVRGAFA